MGHQVHSGTPLGTPCLTSSAPNTKVSQYLCRCHTLLGLCMLHIPPPLTLASSKLYCCYHPSSAPSLSSPQVLSLSHFLLQLYTGGANGEVIVPPNMVVSSLYEWSTDFRPCWSLCRGKDLPFICCNHVNGYEKNKGVDMGTVLQQSVMEQTCKYSGYVYT